jgi:3-dehydrosphinganine reductase
MVSATTSYIVGGVFAGLALIVLFILYLVSDSGPSKSIDLSSPTTHVIITGGSSGIGFAAAKMIREKGASVTIIARDQAKLNQVKKILKILFQ